MCAPKPVFLNAEEMQSAPELPCSLSVILYYIFKIHFFDEPYGRTYVLSAEASVAFNRYFNVNRRQVAETNNLHKDIFLG